MINEKITVEHEGKEITFIDFEQNKLYGNYIETANKIKKAGLRCPTFGETASLIYHGWKNEDKPEGKRILEILDDGGFWAFTGNLFMPYIPDVKELSRAIVQDNPIIEDGKIIMDKSLLLTKIKEKDPSVRLVTPYCRARSGQQSFNSILENSYCITLAGKEGVNKLASVGAGRRYLEAHVSLPQNIGKEFITGSRISSWWEQLMLGSAEPYYNHSALSFGILE